MGPGIHYLDATTVEVDGIRLGGVAGVIGNPSKPFRRSEQDFFAAVEAGSRQALGRVRSLWTGRVTIIVRVHLPLLGLSVSATGMCPSKRASELAVALWVRKVATARKGSGPNCDETHVRFPQGRRV